MKPEPRPAIHMEKQLGWASKLGKTKLGGREIDAKRATPRHIIIKLPKVKGRILKAAREKQKVTYRGVPIGLSVDFSKESL